MLRVEAKIWRKPFAWLVSMTLLALFPPSVSLLASLTVSGGQVCIPSYGASIWERTTTHRIIPCMNIAVFASFRRFQCLGYHWARSSCAGLGMAGDLFLDHGPAETQESSKSGSPRQINNFPVEFDVSTKKSNFRVEFLHFQSCRGRLLLCDSGIFQFGE